MHVAAFHRLRDPDGVAALRRHYARYVALARAAGVGVVLDSPT